MARPPYKPMKAPWRPIPISGFIHEPPWKDAVSIDRPLADGLSGWLDVALTARGKLLVGGERRPTNQGTYVDFFKLPSGELAIPGSSLRGMLRAVLEIAAFGRGAFIDDVRYGVRALQGPTNAIYRARMPAGEIRAGWLQPRDPVTQELTVRPCRWARAHIKDIAAALEKEVDAWNGDGRRGQHVAERYAKAAGANLNNKTMYVEGELVRDAYPATAPGRVARTGTFVFTTKAVGGNADQRYAKKREFFFYDEPGCPAPPIVLTRAWADFLLINTWDEGRTGLQDERRPGWRYWKARHEAGEAVPVFYIIDAEDRLDALGTAMMFRVAHRLGSGALLDHAVAADGARKHSDATVKDIPTLLFGPQLDGEAAEAFKGRVSVGTLVADPDHKPILAAPMTVLLASPSGGFFQATVAQPDGGDTVRGGEYASYTPDPGSTEPLVARPELAGRKRYPSKTEIYRHVGPAGHDNAAMMSILHPVEAGGGFLGRIRFHNLLPIELGALVFAIDHWAPKWGERPDLRHRLGMGKPLGLGDVRLDIASALIEPNRLGEAGERVECIGQAAIETARASADAFADHMSEVFEAAKTAGADVTWATSEQIELLLAMADPDQSDGLYLTYMTLTEHGNATQAGAILPLYPRRSATHGGEPPGAITDRQAFPRPEVERAAAEESEQPTADAPSPAPTTPKPPPPAAAVRYKRDPTGQIAPIGGRAMKPGHTLLVYADGEKIEWPNAELTDP